MALRSFQEEVEAISGSDKRYDVDAYYFLRDALDYTTKTAYSSQSAAAQPRHVSGGELCHGIRDYALQEFGPLALFVLNSWGLRQTSDFGELVYTLIAAGKLSASESDKKSDFDNVYDFHTAFAVPYEVSD